MKQYIVVGRLIDGSGSEIKKGVALVEENGAILDLIAAETVPSGCRERVVDMSHCTIMPPLVDCSVDLASSPSMNSGRSDDKTTTARDSSIARHIHFCHSHGVLGLAVGDHDNTDAVSAQPPGDVDEAVTVRTAGKVYLSTEHRGLKSDVADLDFVKIVHTGGIEAMMNDSKSSESKEKNSLLHLVREAHDKGKKTVVLANGSKAVREALDSGCDAIEQGYNMGEENLEIMASRKILWIPSLIQAKIYLEVASANQRTETAQQLKRQQALLRRARSLDVPIAVGTGAGSPGVIHGEAVIEEIQQFVKSGFTLVEALRSASFTGAEFFKIPEIGLLQAGGRANFIVSRGMVQQLPRKLFYLENIYWQGKPSQGYQKNPIKTVAKT
jgi:imidazolonepropionase-like amidohydrolase